MTALNKNAWNYYFHDENRKKSWKNIKVPENEEY
jgi:hypothetical protein